MPLNWKPKTTIQDRIAQENVRAEQAREKLRMRVNTWTPPQAEAITQVIEQPVFVEPMTQPRFTPVAQPIVETPRPVAAPVTTPKVETVAEPVIPFWQRGLQVFAAPFVWIDEYVIKPGLSLAATTTGAVKEVPRIAGEDFWDWKRRSWAEWDAPGVDINVPWSDDPWRVDIRGIAELAPWLLIPGFGGVGGAVGGIGKVGMKASLVAFRAAVAEGGISGAVSASRIVAGSAIRFSPWGLLESGVQRALGVAVKGVSKVTGGISTRTGEKLFGKIPQPVEPEITPLVKEFGKYLDDVVIPSRKALTEAIPTELTAKQGAKLRVIEKQYREGRITATQRSVLEETALASGGIKGQYAVEPFKFDKAKMDELLDPLYRAAENDFTAVDTVFMMKKLLTDGAMPEPRFFREIQKAYGSKFSKSLRDITRVEPKLWEKIADYLNIPRSVLASGDLSMTFRQGLILVLTRPKDFPKAFYKQLKFFASEKLALEMDDALRAKPFYKTAVEEMGVDFTSWRAAERIATEEAFTSAFTQSLPFIKRSERAAVGFLNEMRMSAAEAAYSTMTAQGATKGQMRLMGDFINAASGRGRLPKNLEKYNPALSAVFFSPKYQMSTLQLPRQIGRMLISPNPYLRKEGATALATFVGGGATLLGLLHATGVGKVEIDPRSSDFGKLVIGDTRLDIWRGYVQYIRLLAQLSTGERKSAYGNLNKADRFDIAFRFLQSKASPATGLLVDMLKGENYQGEPLFEGTTGFTKQVRERLMPLAIQDTLDGMEQNGTNGLWVGIPAMLGIGVLTYVNEFVKIKDRIAKENGYESWDDIDPTTQRKIQNTSTELQVAAIKFDRQSMGTAWGDWTMAGKAVDEVFRTNVDNAVAKYKYDGDGYAFRGKIGKAFDERKGGFKTREADERFVDIVKRMKTQDTAEAWVALGPEQLAIRSYNEALYDDDMYDEFGDYRFDEADVRKQELRKQMGDEMYGYVEDYVGLKNETFPIEYQELVQAKKILAPYWDVANEIVRMFGKAFAESNSGQALIAKLRKQKRMANPQVEMAYQKYYIR